MMFFGVGFAGTVLAQDWPSRAIRFYVGFAPGGSAESSVAWSARSSPSG